MNLHETKAYRYKDSPALNTRTVSRWEPKRNSQLAAAL